MERGRLAGKRALVTGAGQGIGRATALAFAREGASVVAVSRSLHKMEDLPELAPQIAPLKADVGDTDALGRAIAGAGRIDILFNCAAWVQSGPLLDCSDTDWQRSLDLNVSSAFRAIRAVLPQMLARHSGSIINVASVASSITGVANRVAYGASKAALIGLTKGVAREAVGGGVRCNALCPGTTDTPSLHERMDATPDPAATRREFIARQPMGRLGTVEEMAAGAVFLASDESAFMTGQLLVIDGGQTL